MAGKQIAGDGLQPSLAGMSKNQLYEIMSQMKTLIEHNQQQARQILIQNPALTRALFQAQIMLGMVQSPQTAPTISPAPQPNSQTSTVGSQQSNIQVAGSLPGQIGQDQTRKQQKDQPMALNPPSQPSPSPKPQPQSLLPHSIQTIHQPKAYPGPQPPPISVPQLSQVPNLSRLPQHSRPQLPSHHQAPVLPLSTQTQQPMQPSGSQYLPLQPPLQPPLPPQPRPQIPSIPHQVHPQMGPTSGFQYPSGPQMHHPQHMFHTGTKPPGLSFPPRQPPLPNQPLSSSPYQIQAGGPHTGMEFNQVGSSKPTDRGSNWRPAPPESAIGATLPAHPSFPGQMGPSNQPPRAPPLTPEMEKALLQQVMSLTPEQINMLPVDQRNQVLQLQQMLRQ